MICAAEAMEAPVGKAACLAVCVCVGVRVCVCRYVLLRFRSRMRQFEAGDAACVFVLDCWAGFFFFVGARCLDDAVVCLRAG